MDERLPQPIANLIDALQQAPEENTLQHLSEALRVAAEFGPETSAALDAAVVRLLGDRRGGERMLECVALGGLEALARRALARLTAAGDSPPHDSRRRAWDLLDVLRRNRLLCRIAEAGETTAWATQIRALVDASHFTFGQLFAHRAAAYGDRPLFRVPGSAETWGRSRGTRWPAGWSSISRALCADRGSGPGASRSFGEPSGVGTDRFRVPLLGHRQRDDSGNRVRQRRRLHARVKRASGR